jgi:hypothetical protein
MQPSVQLKHLGYMWRLPWLHQSDPRFVLPTRVQ